MKGWSRYDSVLDKLSNIQDCGEYLKARCPAHEDDRASLSLAIGRTGHLIMKCHAGCSFQEILGAARIEMAETFSDSGEKKPAKRGGGIDSVYTYRDEDGVVVYEVVKFQPKSFRPRRPPRDGDSPETVKNGWVWNLKGTRRILYRLDELRTALAEQPDRVVFVVEGEKDVDRLWANGFLATTSVGGAGKWLDTYSPSLDGCTVIVVPDKDTINEKTGKSPGMEHARDVYAKLTGVAKSIAILELPGLPDSGGDMSDWFDRGGTTEKLKTLAQKALKPDLQEDNAKAPLDDLPEWSSPVVMELSVREMVTAGEFGVIRRSNQLMQNKKTGRGTMGWEYCIENVAGEIAVAKAFGWYWQGGLSGSKIPIIVRVRKNEEHDLVVRPTDDDNACYVFVTGCCPTFKIWGAIEGATAKKFELKKVDGVESHVVGKEALRDPRSAWNGC